MKNEIIHDFNDTLFHTIKLLLHFFLTNNNNNNNIEYLGALKSNNTYALTITNI